MPTNNKSFLLLLLCVSISSFANAQQATGQFIQMDGGFEGQPYASFSNQVTNEEVCRASLEYDFELVGSPTIPTWLYKLNRNRIETTWKESLAALEAKWTTTTVESLDGSK